MYGILPKVVEMTICWFEIFLLERNGGGGGEGSLGLFYCLILYGLKVPKCEILISWIFMIFLSWNLYR